MRKLNKIKNRLVNSGNKFSPVWPYYVENTCR